MKTVKAYAKRMLLSVAYVTSFAASFYLSILLFLYLLLRQAFSGRVDRELVINAGIWVKDVYDAPDKLREFLNPEAERQNSYY